MDRYDEMENSATPRSRFRGWSGDDGLQQQQQRWRHRFDEREVNDEQHHGFDRYDGRRHWNRSERRSYDWHRDNRNWHHRRDGNWHHRHVCGLSKPHQQRNQTLTFRHSRGLK
jgi:hypothetical protein